MNHSPVELAPRPNASRLLYADVPTAHAIALCDHRRAFASNVPMAGAANCQTILGQIVTAERTFLNVVILDITGEQLSRAFLTLAATAVPGDKFGAFAELVSHIIPIKLPTDAASGTIQRRPAPLRALGGAVDLSGFEKGVGITPLHESVVQV